jgi:hypothetical protein
VSFSAAVTGEGETVVVGGVMMEEDGVHEASIEGGEAHIDASCNCVSNTPSDESSGDVFPQQL